MNTLNEYILSPLDRCDRCSAEALVLVRGVGGELYFCGHHYNDIVDSKTGYEKLANFSYEVIDERDKLVQKNN